MLVEMWSDIICPICGITQHRLRAAVARTGHGADFEVVHRSFPIHPDLPPEGVTQTELARRAGAPVERVNAMLRRLEGEAETEGFGHYRAVDRTLGPTALTHELLALATDRGRHAETWEAMFTAHFSRGRQLWTVDQLVDFAPEAGLDAVEAREALESRRYRDRVEAEQARAQALGAHGTPFLVIDGRYVITGGVGTEALTDALTRAWRERRPEPVPDLVEGATCTDEGCVA